MTSQAERKLLSELLNLERVKVTADSQHEGIGIILHLCSENLEETCPRCGTKSDKLHQNHRYLVKDLPLSARPVYLAVNRRQFKCSQCRKPFSKAFS